MQVVPSGFRAPADKIVSGFELPGGRASPRRRPVIPLRAGGPAQTGNGPISDKGDVFKMIALRGVGSLCLYEPEADDLTIAQVMVLLDQRVVEWFEFCVSDRFEFKGSQIAQFIL